MSQLAEVLRRYTTLCSNAADEVSVAPPLAGVSPWLTQWATGPLSCPPVQHHTTHGSRHYGRDTFPVQCWPRRYFIWPKSKQFQVPIIFVVTRAATPAKGVVVIEQHGFDYLFYGPVIAADPVPTMAAEIVRRTCRPPGLSVTLIAASRLRNG